MAQTQTTDQQTTDQQTPKPGKIKRLVQYLWNGVWEVPSTSWHVKLLKTLNLSVRTFLNSELQNRASALTYTSVLSIVPLFALMLAIGRGFGLQDLLQHALYSYFPGQEQAVAFALKFVDAYLEEASQGMFVGIGIVFLLWTLISLLSNIESSFNRIWGLKGDRSFLRKVTDYTAIIVMVPILVICSSGLSIFLTQAMMSFFRIKILSPVLSICLDATPFVLTCLALTVSFLIIPNTEVKFKYALISGIITGIAFQLLQDLFVHGQIYVSKYNAIYGSFAFLPLLLIWMQLSWLIVLFGCVLTYSSQYIFRFNFTDNIDDISIRFRQYITTVVMSVCVQRFVKGERPLSVEELSHQYDLPIRLVTRTVENLRKCGLVYDVVLGKESTGITPAVDPYTLTVGEVLQKMSEVGANSHMPGFHVKYAKLIERLDPVLDKGLTEDTMLVKDMPV